MFSQIWFLSSNGTNFFSRTEFFVVFSLFSRMAGSSFFVFLVFIRMLIRFSDIKMESIFVSSNVFLFYVLFSFNIMEPFLSFRSSSFLCLYHSGKCWYWNKSVLLYCGFVIQENVFQAGVSFLFCFVDFSWVTLDNRYERVDESFDLRWFLEKFI